MSFIRMLCNDVHDAWTLSGYLQTMSICCVVLDVCAILQFSVCVYGVLSICKKNKEVR